MRRKRHCPAEQLDVFGYRPDDEPVPYVPPKVAPRVEPEPPPPTYTARPVRKRLGILPPDAPTIPLPPAPLDGGYEVTLDIEPEYDVELCILHPPRGYITHRRRVLVTDKEIEWHVAALFSAVSPKHGTRIVASDRTRGIRWVLTYDRKGEWRCTVKPCKTSSSYRKSVLA